MPLQPTKAKLDTMWDRSVRENRSLFVLAVLPDGTEVAGIVTGHGSLFGVLDTETNRVVEDIRPEWIQAAVLSVRRV